MGMPRASRGIRASIPEPGIHPVYLLLNADLYTPRKVGRRHLLIVGEGIAWIGEEIPDLPASLGVERVDLDGRPVVPGFIDGHVHITGGGGEAGFASRVPPLALSRITRGGATTVIGLLGTDDVMRSTAELVARARALCDEGITAYCLAGGYHLPPTTLTGSVKTDILHVDPILGVGEVAISDHRSSQPTLDEILRLAADVRVAGMLAGKAGVLQLHLGRGPRRLDLVRRALAESELPPRTFHPTHVNLTKGLLSEAFDLARAGGVIDVSAFETAEDDDEPSAVESIQAYWEASLPPDGLTVSSDGGGSMPCFDTRGRLHSMGVGDPTTLAAAFAALVAAGAPLELALPPFTSNVAGLYRLDAKGRLEVGRDADLLVLDEEARPIDVMARGRWHVRDGEVIVRGTFEEA